MIITRVGAGGVVLAADGIGLLGLVVVRFPVILSVEANLSVVGTVPVSLTVIPFPGITTIALLMVTIAAIAFLAVAIMAVVFPMVVMAIVFLAVSFLPVVCVFIGLVSKEAISIVVTVQV